MAPRQKGCSWLLKNRYNMGDDQIESLTTPYKKLKKTVTDDANIEEWLRTFLDDLAVIEATKNKSKKFANSLHSENQRQDIYGRFRSPMPNQWNPPKTKFPAALPYSTDFESSATINDEIIPLLNLLKTKSKKCQKHRYSSKNVSKNKVSKSYTIFQKINQFIRAGIEEGKRQARRYVRKALTFALHMGYLEPADTEGKLLRLSRTLTNSVQRKKGKIRLTRRLTRKAPQKKHRRKAIVQVATISDRKKRKSR
ncbi:PREDICTED: uncharacterized protein LOC105360985 [Ceratosolen solmsi marchali]|uniref:Uncharacterized protein LOC105360985 n=1 Tax=Ceratosolen solmsi marchali TaxID=326594 RepID=A0AAJ7DTW2_9HYME|nr:PREDICTED: uncharacterized protein LOC105360985 [Ceratosolen solmsi marchali]